MNGRNLSVFALVGSLATLVLVATFAGAGDVNPAPVHSAQAVRVATPSWTHFRVRPALLLREGMLSEGKPGGSVAESTAQSVTWPTSRAIYRYVREQTGKGRVVLVSYDR